eukprot:TRINITY_DN873_c0_g1_i4.p1 TRINITY_DN873_c0_g1~~TRINITY_DN873_c0_g1_i4.p1  ORF type:complete len:268 (-),score=41.90 TRINITY_DN873_c0_g1_i4:129-932(-)
MLITESFHDIQTSSGPMRVFIFHPIVQGFPHAKFPGVVVFSEIFQVTGPVQRFAKKIAGLGYIVVSPCSFHEFAGVEEIPYTQEGTDSGNLYKISKKLSQYDEDAKLTIDFLSQLPNCNGKIGVTGMCLGGHLTFRAAFDKRVLAAVPFFGTDIHSHTLGEGKNDDSLHRVKEIQGELIMIFGKKDTHIPLEGRDLIRKVLNENSILHSWYEIEHAQHAFVRDESSKGRYDPAITGVCFTMMIELFERTIKLDLGKYDQPPKIEHVC